MLTPHLTMARRLVVLTLLLVAAVGCSVKFVADYDAATFDEILKTGKLVDRFYGDMLETPEAQRKYAAYSARYVEVETDIRSLLIRNKVRPLNTESIKINETILNLWMKYKDNHQKNDGYRTGVARLDRSRFLRLFAAAADAESAKRLASDDKNSDKDSK
jgi:hypothetical protein